MKHEMLGFARCILMDNTPIRSWLIFLVLVDNELVSSSELDLRNDTRAEGLFHTANFQNTILLIGRLMRNAADELSNYWGTSARGAVTAKIGEHSRLIT